MCDVLSISYVKMNLSQIFRNFQNGRHFEVQVRYWTGSCTEFVLYTKIGYAIPYILIFVRRSSLNINGVMAISKFDLLFDLVT